MVNINYSNNTIVLLFVVIIILYMLSNTNLLNCKYSRKQNKQNETFSGLNNKVLIQTSSNKCNKTYIDTSSLTNINQYNTSKFNKLVTESKQNRPPLCSNDNDNDYCNIEKEAEQSKYNEKKNK